MEAGTLPISLDKIADILSAISKANAIAKFNNQFLTIGIHINHPINDILLEQVKQAGCSIHSVLSASGLKNNGCPDCSYPLTFEYVPDYRGMRAWCTNCRLLRIWTVANQFNRERVS